MPALAQVFPIIARIERTATQGLRRFELDGLHCAPALPAFAPAYCNFALRLCNREQLKSNIGQGFFDFAQRWSNFAQRQYSFPQNSRNPVPFSPRALRERGWGRGGLHARLPNLTVAIQNLDPADER